MADGFAGSPVILSYTVVHILTAVLSLSVAVYTARNHWHKSLGQAFTVLLASASIWTTGSLARLFTSTPDGFIAASTFKYVGIVTAPVLFILFTLLYDGKTQWVTRRVVTSLLVVPAVTVPIVGTTQLHGLFYSDYTTAVIDNVTVLAIQTVGPWYWLYVVYGWGLVAIGSGLLIHAGIKRSRFYWAQLLVLLPAIGISWMTNVLYVGWSWPHPALDPTPIGFAVTCLLLGFGLFSTQLVEVSPAARSLVFEVIDNAVIVVDDKNRVVDLNSAAQPLFADTDPVGEELTTILVADVAQQIAAGLDTIELNEEPTTRHYQYRELSIESGKERVLVFTDITDRKERERELEQFREAVEQTAHAVYITDTDGTIEYVNPAFEAVTGYSEAEAVGATPRILQSGEYSEAFYEEFWETILSGEQWKDEIIDQRADGEQIVLEQTIAPIRDEDDRPQRFVAVAQDITERKESKQALEQAREELRQIIDLIPDPIFSKNRDDEVLLSNEANAELVGSTAEEIEGKPEPELFPETDHYETLRQRDVEVIESGEPTTFEEELTSADGEKHIFDTTRIPFKTAKTAEDAVLGYARDVTELKEYEQELEQQRDNLEILNEVLRHDVRNDLQLVTAYADLLVEECEDDEIKEYITTIQSSADHAVELTETAREIADVMLSDTTQGQQVNLRNVLEKEVSEVQSSYPDAAVTYGTTIPSVAIITNDMISSVFRNLLKNAIKHNDKAVAEVTVSATEQDDVVAIRIADNGPGVSDDQKDTLFGKGERGLESTGSGMGLYLVDTLVTSYGGEVWIEDNDPEGSIFVVELPIAS
jgi:PAS domain S-box-containing protein